MEQECILVGCVPPARYRKYADRCVGDVCNTLFLFQMKASVYNQLFKVNTTFIKYNILAGIENLGMADCNKYYVSFVQYFVKSKSDYPCQFFRANQRQANIKIYSIIQYQISVTRCDSHILVGYQNLQPKKNTFSLRRFP